MAENKGDNGNCLGIIIFSATTLFFAYPALRILINSWAFKYIVIGAIILLLMNFLSNNK